MTLSSHTYVTLFQFGLMFSLSTINIVTIGKAAMNAASAKPLHELQMLQSVSNNCGFDHALK